MATWSVRVELAAPCAVSDDLTDELTDRLADYAAAVAVEDDDRVTVQLTVEAGTLRAAFTRGEKAMTDAIADLLRDAEVIEVQVLTQQEFERRLENPRVPELWGVSEIAEFLGVSAPRVDQLVKENPEKLPMVQKLKGKQGPRIWLKSTWVRFEAAWERKRGRPRSDTPAATAVRAG
jgi:hypothetical protein